MSLDNIKPNRKRNKMTLNELCDQYDDFLFENDLPPMSADELLFEHDLTPEQCEYLEQFIEAWHVAEKQ